MRDDAEGKDAPKRAKSDPDVDLPLTMLYVLMKSQLRKSLKTNDPSCFKMSADVAAVLPSEVCDQLIFIAGHAFGLWAPLGIIWLPLPVFPLVAVVLVASVEKGYFKPKKDTRVMREARKVSKDHPALQQWADAYPFDRVYSVLSNISANNEYFDTKVFYKDIFKCNIELDVIDKSDLQKSDTVLAQALLVALAKGDNSPEHYKEAVEVLLSSIRLVKDTK